MKKQSECEIFNSRGRALIHIAAHPRCTIKDLSTALYLTPRTVWEIIGDLRRAGMISADRRGHRHYYTANLDTEIYHPTLKGLTLWKMTWAGGWPQYSRRSND